MQPSPAAERIRRCAIYTRKSVEPPGHQDFNSLQSQQAVCQAYIQSQHHRGWVEAEKYYEDAGFSGGSLNRPGMQRLLTDVERGLIDVVVVYKLDRLSRSLLDFIRLLDVFDRYGVSFCCITQNFDTGDSLGRLVMNVLLTFAQFEREMAADRIRDKKRAMCARGLWYGGRPPFGYDLVAHKLVVNPDEASIVRRLYNDFVKFRSYTRLERDCLAGGVFSKTWITRHGVLIEGTPMRAASIRNILCNPIYSGYLSNKGDLYQGIHQPIIDPDLWRKVASLLEGKVRERKIAAREDLLDGITFDCFGRRMRCDRQYKKSGWCAHYRSYQSEWGRANGVSRISIDARQAEQLVISAIRQFFADPERLRPMLLRMGRHEAEKTASRGLAANTKFERLSPGQLRSAVRGLVSRIEVSTERLYLVMRAPEAERFLDWDCIGFFRAVVDKSNRNTFLLEVAFSKVIRRLGPIDYPTQAASARRQKPNARLVSLIDEARKAQSYIETHFGKPPAELAAMLRRDQNYLKKILKLNYLAPDILMAIREGTQPRHLTRRHLTDVTLPLDWVLQRELLGFPSPTQPSQVAAEFKDAPPLKSLADRGKNDRPVPYVVP